jgi:hypothetical protein
MRSPLWLPYRLLTVAVAFILATALSGLAQDCRVTTTVRLLGKDERPVLNVAADQLTAEIGGAPAKVVSFSPGVKPVMILLIDISSSMKGTWAQAVAAAKQLSGNAGDRVAVVVFREQVVAHAGGRVDTDKLLDRLATLKTSQGGTALYDTLIDTAGGVKDRNTALVVITDGGDNASRHSSDQTVHLFLQSSWPPVFGLVLDYDHEQTRREYFKKIVAGTGGLVAFPSSASKVAEAVNELAAEVYAPFAVTLQPSQPISKPTKLKLEVVGSDNKPRHDIQVAHVAEVTGCDLAPSSPTKAD